MDKKKIKEMKKVAMNAIKIVLESEKQQNIIGYKIFNVDNDSYLKFKGKPSIKTVEYSENFDEGHIFKSRIDALPIMIRLTCKFELKPITKKHF
ncbi:hypothetical protein [Arsenophonus sp.]|uniref:hypothetical protein n=1 Tax=Arsenophonus sp. TaxID=1872640 RepID=UPI00285C1E33|nr:hypothetical protein [Arsenophonus sp.]MDR5617379.1 hypothetical protein [Arsenophonus sp.]MDR5617547.1 hypothetical protein [Arsenophonus sp.]MDR5617786.1 hypothetical protein [Arsenophonus sp.]MDR5617797.1 hypothetical protein [Arsenophonus sp.]MDR5617959.1 hypothetical protein [Arsenophonus sp.]